ncbi:hypothetical protein KR093_010198 [Drosophila rubida]|uniref:MYND-type domain-containing protein n=1 Tax=Drosophila rubida TaxID=30044 RepID=A0AAD4PJI5_9MUSC|nr:hypothetical protein KR093_010198 [Drosophila rubida]
MQLIIVYFETAELSHNMANVEIYDSSNSQLSSDEYSHDEDDDGLMDVAVIGKPQLEQQQTPTKHQQSAKSNTTTNSSSTSTTPSKSTSNETTPRKLSSNDDAILEDGKKPPDSSERTQRQIKQMQRNNNANLYFKRRSIKWLNQRFANKIDYLLRLKQTMPKHLEHERRMNAYRAKKRAFEMAQRARPARPFERTPSHSRTHSRSDSPELICLDDTENEDSPEKPGVEPPPTPRNETHRALVQMLKTPTSPFAVQQEVEAVTVTDTPPAENGSVLNEFLTLKPNAVAEPIIEAAKEQQQPQQLDLTVLSSYKVEVAIEPAVACLELPLEEANLKRRRSSTPPATAEAAETEKRSKPMPAEELDDDIVELITSDMSTVAKQLVAAAATPQPPPPQSATLPKAASLNAINSEATNAATVLKLGSPYSLTTATPAYFGNNPHREQSSKPQIVVDHEVPISYSLELPPTRLEAMEIDYAKPQLEAVPNTMQKSAKDTFAAPYAAHQQQQQQQLLQSAQQLYQQQEQHYQQQLQAAEQQQQEQQRAAELQLQQQQQQRAAQQQQLLQQQQQAALQQQQAAQQQQLQSQQQPQPQQVLPQQQQLPQTPPRSKSRQAQTQTASPQPPPPPPTAGRSSKSRADLNNTNNSDATFHERVRELYTELDEIMTDKVRAVKPELKAFAEEKQRIDSDIRTLDNLIVKKEEEHNRLLHLRCIKGELRARVERKERMLIMREILPSILNKNCNTSDLYGMQSMLLQEYNAPMPNRSATSAMEQLINRVENGIDDVKMLRSALGMLERETSGEGRYDDMQPLQRSNSVPVMRPLPPLLSADRSATYGRQGPVRDVRGLIEDYRREHPEQVPLVGKRSKVQPPPSRYQQLINESKQMTNSSMNLAASSSSSNPSVLQQQPNNHFDGEMPHKPLYNSSPLAAGGRNPNNSRNQSNIDVQYGATHSTHYAEQMHELEAIEKAHRNRIVNNNNHSNYNNRSASAINGPEELQRAGERRCQHCERSKACYVCEGCMNQWYCSQECQTKGWDTHWKSCHN